jgi:hypothetical protein
MERERELLDMHVMFFPKDCPTGYEWRVIKSEERLSEERLAREVEAVKMNRSDRRAHVGPHPVVREPGLGPMIEALNRGLQRRQLRETQGELFGLVPKDDLRPDGKRR